MSRNNSGRWERIDRSCMENLLLKKEKGAVAKSAYVIHKALTPLFNSSSVIKNFDSKVARPPFPTLTQKKKKVCGNETRLTSYWHFLWLPTNVTISTIFYKIVYTF